MLLLGTMSMAAVDFVDSTVILPVDYHAFSTEDQATIVQSGTIKLTNPDAQETNVTFTIENLPAGYSVASVSPAVVSANGTAESSFSLNVPHKEGSGKKTIGIVVMRNEAGVEIARRDVVQETKSMLDLRKFEVRYTNHEGKTEKDDFDPDKENFDVSEDIKPGTILSLRIELENFFDTEYDDRESILEDITITFDVDDSDLFEEDIEDEEHDVPEIDADKKESITFEFPFSAEAEEGKYTLKTTIEGKDGNRAKYKIVRELHLELRRERDDVRVAQASIMPLTITACDKDFSLEVELKNYGTKRQSDTAVSIVNQELEINRRVEKIDLEEFSDDDNNWEERFVFPLPNGKAAKTYQLAVNAYIQNKELQEAKTVDLVLGACPVEEIEEEVVPPPRQVNRSVPSTVQSAPAVQQQEEAGGQMDIVRTTEKLTYNKEDVVIGLMVAGIVMVFALIVALFIKLLK